MVPAYSYEIACQELTRAFHDRYPSNSESKVRMVGLLFARPTSPLAAQEILPNLDYFHHRSGNNIDFFCAGYGQYWEGWLNEFPDQKKVARGKYENWLYSNLKFDQFRKEIESMTDWKYSGGVDLLLTNAKFDVARKSAYINFGSTISCSLDRMKSDKAIDSVEMFFESIFRYAERQNGDDPTWGFSEQHSFEVAGSALKRFVLSLIPKKIGDDVQRLLHFAVKDVSIIK